MAKVKFFKGQSNNLPKTGLTPGAYYQVETSGKLYYAYSNTGMRQIGSELDYLTVIGDASVYGHLKATYIDSEDENGLYLSGYGYNVEQNNYPFYIDNTDSCVEIGRNKDKVSVDMSLAKAVKLPCIEIDRNVVDEEEILVIDMSSAGEVKLPSDSSIIKLGDNVITPSSIRVNYSHTLYSINPMKVSEVIQVYLPDGVIPLGSIEATAAPFKGSSSIEGLGLVTEGENCGKFYVSCKVEGTTIDPNSGIGEEIIGDECSFTTTGYINFSGLFLKLK